MSDSTERLVEAAETEWFDMFTAGPERPRWDDLPPQVGDQAPDLELLDEDGEAIRLSDRWDSGPALLLFWRHFGCGCGTERAARLADEFDDYVEAGATVTIIAEGEPPRAREYAAEHDIPCPLVCDPERAAYEAYGLRDFLPSQVLHGASDALLDLDADAADAIATERREQGRPLVDNPWQQPGEFVVGADGTLALVYRYQYCEDYPEPEVLETAIRGATD